MVGVFARGERHWERDTQQRLAMGQWRQRLELHICKPRMVGKHQELRETRRDPLQVSEGAWAFWSSWSQISASRAVREHIPVDFSNSACGPSITASPGFHTTPTEGFDHLLSPEIPDWPDHRPASIYKMHPEWLASPVWQSLPVCKAFTPHVY
jgi:hypothetical protein